MKFREVKQSDETILAVQHLSNGRLIGNIDDQNRLWTDYLLDKAEEKLASPIISDPYVPTFEENKTQKITDVDSKSNQMLGSGFVYDAATFSMAPIDQERWKEMLLAAESGLLVYPVVVYDVSKQPKNITDLSEVKNFCTAFMNARETILAPGRVLKSEMEDAQNQAELDAIVDNR